MKYIRFTAEILLATIFALSIITSLLFIIGAPMTLCSCTHQPLWLLIYASYSIVAYLLYKLLV